MHASRHRHETEVGENTHRIALEQSLSRWHYFKIGVDRCMPIVHTLTMNTGQDTERSTTKGEQMSKEELGKRWIKLSSERQTMLLEEFGGDCFEDIAEELLNWYIYMGGR